MIDINELIKQAMKSRNQVELRAYKNLKSEIQVLQTAKNAKPYDEVAEIQLISKMCKKLEDSCREFSEAGREDLISEYRDELEVLKKLLPEPVNERQLRGSLEDWCLKNKFIHSYLDNGKECPMEGYTLQIPKKEMGNAIKYLKSKFPAVDGKIISEIVKAYIICPIL